MQHLPLRVRLVILAVLLALGAQPIALAFEVSRQYTVQPGDTLSEISASAGVPIERLMELNNLTDPDRIIAGQTLLIDSPAPSEDAPAEPAAADGNQVYIVRPGDTLSQIALQLGVPAERLAELNNLADPNRLAAGQKLLLPARRERATPTADRAAASNGSSDTQVGQLIEQVAGTYRLDAALVKALAWYLSGWKQDATSPTGAVGVMQITGATQDWVASTLLKRNVDRSDPRDNIEIGVAYLAYLINKMGDERQGVAAYLQGPGSVAQRGISSTVQRALDVIYGSRARFSGSSGSGGLAAVTVQPAAGNTGDLAASIARAARTVSSTARLGVAARNLTTGDRVDLRANEIFPSASVNKVAILTEIFNQIASGQLRRSSALDASMERMITLSDNDAANRLLDLVGEQNVNATMAGLGLRNTQMHNYFSNSRGPLDPGFNQTTPAEMATLFALVATGKLVSPAASQEMLGLLSRAQDNSKIVRGLPPGTRVAHKSGWYAGVANDVGIVYAPRATYVVAVFSVGTPDPETGNRLVAAVSQAVYEAWGQ